MKRLEKWYFLVEHGESIECYKTKAEAQAFRHGVEWLVKQLGDPSRGWDVELEIEELEIPQEPEEVT